MKQPKYNFNLEWNKNKNGSRLIFFNLSYGYKEFDTITQRYKYPPFRISTEYSIAPEYWKGRPTYRANRTYTQKFGKDLNNILQKIEETSLHQLSLYKDENDRNPTPSELKRLIQIKLNRVDKISNDVIITKYIDDLVTKRTSLATSSRQKWSKATGNQYTNLSNYIKQYEKLKNTILTFGSITSEIYWDYFKTVNEIKKVETGEYFIQSTIANQCKNLKSVFNIADKEDIEIGFNYSKPEFKIDPSPSSYETYLTEEQLKKIIETDVTGLLKKYEHARNFIIISCLTGLRIGDMKGLSDIKPEKIRHNSKIYDCFQTKIRKSNENREELTVILPILKSVRALIDSNNSKFPDFPSEQKIRLYIQDFLKYLEFNNEVQKTYYYYLFGAEVKNIKQSEIFSPHDCRRTFITNLKQLGIQNETIEPLTHPKLKFKSVLDQYDKSSLNDKAVKFINELNSKKSKLYRH
jgi:integrase